MGRYLLFVFLFALPGLGGYAQSTSPDSPLGFKQAIAAEKTDTVKISLMHKLGKYYIAKYVAVPKTAYIDTAIIALKQAVALSAAVHQDNYKYEGIRLISSAYMFKKDSANARPYVAQALQFYTRTRQFKLVVHTWLRYGNAAHRAAYYQMAMECFNQALEVELKNHLQDQEIFIRNQIVQEYYTMGNEERAIQSALATITLMKGRKKSVQKLYLFLAEMYRYHGDLQRSLSYSLACVSDMELYKDTVNADSNYGELALTYDVLGQTEKSIVYYRKTLVARIRKGSPEHFIFRTLGFLIKGLIKQGRVKDALAEAKYFERLHPPKTVAGKSDMAQNYAYCYEALKDYDKAEKYYLEMVKGIDTTAPHDEIAMIACFDIGSFYVARGQYDKAKAYAQQIGQEGSSLGNNKNFEQLRFKIDSATGDYRSALFHYSKYQQAKDSLFNVSKIREIEELQIKYETNKKENDIEGLRKDSQVQRDRVKQANNTRNLTFIGTTLLLVLFGLLYKSYRTNQHKTREINLKNASLNQLLTEKDNLLDEKEWLMKEVHHRVKNNLQIVMGLLQRQSSFVDNKDALNAIRNSEHRMHSIALIHQKLYQSESLTLVNMPDYIGEMIGYLRESFDLGTRVQFEKDIEDIDFDINVAVPLGLLLNEAITNAIKYAFPTYENGRIRVTLKQTADACYSLKIIDNGQGLPAGMDTKKTNSMGFNLMRGLSKQVGGTCAITGDAGTAITINFCP